MADTDDSRALDIAAVLKADIDAAIQRSGLAFADILGTLTHVVIEHTKQRSMTPARAIEMIAACVALSTENGANMEPEDPRVTEGAFAILGQALGNIMGDLGIPTVVIGCRGKQTDAAGAGGVPS
jgi:hypothetical protein